MHSWLSATFSRPAADDAGRAGGTIHPGSYQGEDALSISERTAKAQRLLQMLAGPLWVHFRDLYDDRGQLISHSRTQPGLLVTCK
jgi:hypothetical protein